MEPMEIRANFKQATVKGGTAVLQLEILTSDGNAFPILKLSGKPVVLTVADIQDELPLDYDEQDDDEDEGEPLPLDYDEQDDDEDEGEPLPFDYDEQDDDEDEGEPLPFDRPANVDAETGEVYEVIVDEARMIGDGE